MNGNTIKMSIFIKFLLEAQNDSSIDPILIPDSYADGQEIEDEDFERLLEMVSIVNETAISTFLVSTSTQEQRYLNEALQAIENTDKFALLNSKFISATLQQYLILFRSSQHIEPSYLLYRIRFQ